MLSWLRGKSNAVTRGLAVLLVLTILVAAALAWLTRLALRVEQEQLAQQARADRDEKVRLALWRLDSRMSTFVAREDTRPFNHYSAIFAPTLAVDNRGTTWPSGSIIEPSPLLHAELPPWMLLHFQADARGWESPQVLSPQLKAWLTRSTLKVPTGNVTAERRQLLAELSRELPAALLLERTRQKAGQTTTRDRVLMAQLGAEVAQFNYGNTTEFKDQLNLREFGSRGGYQSKLAVASKNMTTERIAKDVALLNSCRNGEEWLSAWSLQVNPMAGQQAGGLPGNRFYADTLNAPAQAPGLNFMPQQVPAPLPPSAEVTVRLRPMAGLWLAKPGAKRPDRLMLLRLVHLEEKEACQGIVLDVAQLLALLAEEVQDLFSGAKVLPAHDATPEQLPLMMTVLPLRLDPGQLPAAEEQGWTGLRVGLALAWAAASVALIAVGLGGWSLIDLSERRMRFVSAVTHELRTPLTTLRLYLDMLLNGLVREEQKKGEYLRTMDAETDRLTRLVSNVLDYSRLEDRQPRLSLVNVRVSEMLVQLGAIWSTRCEVAGKHLVLEDQTGEGVLVHTDGGLLGQVLGNLIDNAIKYSRDAEDPHIWLRARREGALLILEVEDRGPGIPAGERRAIFRPFRRGKGASTMGGVGLGLALARTWISLLGGKLILCPHSSVGACFRLELPCAVTTSP